MYDDGYVLEYTIPIKGTVKIRNVKVNIECRNCHNRWGVYMLANGTLPSGWEVCKVCNKNLNVGDYVKNYEYKNSTKQ